MVLLANPYPMPTFENLTEGIARATSRAVAVARPAQDLICARARGVAQRHSKQLVDRVHARSSEQFKRSIFGMVQCYNALPQSIVDEATVSSFQKRIQQGVMNRIRNGQVDNWQNIFRDGRRYSSLLRFQAFFT